MDSNYFTGLSELICKSDEARELYALMPYDMQRELINNKNEIHSLFDLKQYAGLSEDNI